MDENVEIVSSNYEHLRQVGEPDREIYALDVVCDASRVPGFGTYRALDDFLSAWREYRNTFDKWCTDVEELRGHGARVFARVRDRGRMKSGGEVSNHYFHVWELREDKVVAWTVFLDRSEALEAAGLSE